MADAGADEVVTFVVANAWRGVGIGHSIFASAQWLTLGSMLPARIRFAFCVPAEAPARYLRLGGRQYPNCSAPGTFDLHEHLTREGDDLRASADDFRRVDRLLQSPSCQQLVDAAQSRSSPVVLVYDSLPKNMLMGCLRQLGNATSASFDGQLVVVPELRKLALAAASAATLRCRPAHPHHGRRPAGLAPSSPRAAAATSSAGGTRLLTRSPGPRLLQQGPRFVTSDDPSMSCARAHLAEQRRTRSQPVARPGARACGRFVSGAGQTHRGGVAHARLMQARHRRTNRLGFLAAGAPPCGQGRTLCPMLPAATVQPQRTWR